MPPEKREKVERGLYIRGKTYYACVTPKGSRKARWRKIGEVGLMAAREERARFEVEVRSDRRPRGQRLKFSEVAAMWLAVQRERNEAGRLADATFNGYEVSVRLHLEPFFGDRYVDSIDAEDLLAWQVDQGRIRMQKGKRAGEPPAPSSIRTRWMALRGVLRHAKRKHLIPASPVDLLEEHETPQAGGSTQVILSNAQIERLLASTPDRYKPSVAVLVFGGLRISEALGLAWGDVDLRAGGLCVDYQRDQVGKRVQLKTAHSRRRVDVMPSLSVLLREAKIAARYSQNDHPVFATAGGSAISKRNAERAFSKIAKRAELVGITPHSLRHTFASILIYGGRDATYVCDQLGHASPDITLRVYARLFRAATQAKQARQAMEAQYGAMLRG